MLQRECNNNATWYLSAIIMITYWINRIKDYTGECGRNGIFAEKVGITTLGRYCVLVSTRGNAQLVHFGVQGGGFQAQ